MNLAKGFLKFYTLIIALTAANSFYLYINKAAISPWLQQIFVFMVLCGVVFNSVKEAQGQFKPSEKIFFVVLGLSAPVAAIFFNPRSVGLEHSSSLVIGVALIFVVGSSIAAVFAMESAAKSSIEFDKTNDEY